MRAQEPSVTSIGDVTRWTLQFVGNGHAPQELIEDGAQVHLIQGPRAARISVRIPDAVRLPADAFEEATVTAYAMIRRALGERPELSLVRMWNFIPEILAPLDPFPQRYMAFNAGRFRAFKEWKHGAADLSAWVPTSSGVGNPGPDLIVHALASEDPGTPVENLRQVPAYRYSRRYGPRPPCFARGVRLSADGPGSALLMIGGTASVVGEHTRHPGDLRAQIEETLQNLIALIRIGLPEAEATRGHRDPLGCIRQLVAYYVDTADRPAIESLVRARLDSVPHIEFVQTTLCRPDLLVEIEGIATHGDTVVFAGTEPI